MEIKEALKLLDELNIMTLYDGDSICNSEFAEALKIAISALEKQEAKKPVNVCYCEGKIESAECPSCGYDFPDIGGVCESYHECEQYSYCPDCGQRIDWSE